MSGDALCSTYDVVLGSTLADVFDDGLACLCSNALADMFSNGVDDVLVAVLHQFSVSNSCLAIRCGDCGQPLLTFNQTTKCVANPK